MFEEAILVRGDRLLERQVDLALDLPGLPHPDRDVVSGRDVARDEKRGRLHLAGHRRPREDLGRLLNRRWVPGQAWHRIVRDVRRHAGAALAPVPARGGRLRRELGVALGVVTRGARLRCAVVSAARECREHRSRCGAEKLAAGEGGVFGGGVGRFSLRHGGVRKLQDPRVREVYEGQPRGGYPQVQVLFMPSN